MSSATARAGWDVATRCARNELAQNDVAARRECTCAVLSEPSPAPSWVLFLLLPLLLPLLLLLLLLLPLSLLLMLAGA